MIPLQHQANAAMAAIDAAKTPMQKHQARQEGLAVKADLEREIGNEKALNAFKNAKPQNSGGMWNGVPRMIYMARADGSKPVAAVELPDGTKVLPIQGQIPVPENQVPAMTARGWKRFNDVINDQHTGMRDPARPNNV
jgi:hypothetical protein